ncbi:MAG: treY [Tardiphaga sp.]|nr:treY [Tardiphaga sp.]
MPSAIPVATYRVQLTADFGFDKAAAIVPYLASLGITHLYASPFLKARAGSTHGYDIVDHAQFNPELGGEEAFERLSAALKQNQLGLILDFVPNHVGVHFADNPWWLDVLEWGPASPHAVSFDIDWDTLPFRARGGVLLPIIGNGYGAALDGGEIELKYDAAEGSFSAWYYEHRLPIAPERYGEILRNIVKQADAADDDAGRALLALAAQHRGLRHPNYQEAPAFKRDIAAVDGGADLIARGLDAYKAGPGRPVQTKTLHNLLERQHYKLGHWRLASSEINYRRFFDVNTLAGLRVENAGTFDAIHRLVKRLIAEDKLQGLRLDHIDGLRDPAQYFQRLKRLIRDAQGGKAKPFYLLIEKILGEHEKLVPLAGVHGTTGYEWMNVITQVLVDGKGLGELDETWRQASNVSPNFPPLLKDAKRRVLETLLLSEFTVLTRLLSRIASGHYSTRDFSADSLRQAFELYVLHFPVYRTYLTAAGPSAGDRALIEETIAKARADWFGPDEGIFDFLRDALTLDLLKADNSGTHSIPRVRRFALKVQQFTGPAMAKSLEDTAFYRYHRLLALNEVGGEPAATAMPLETFHAMMQTRVRETPHGLTSTATHDTKRGEDARARILALAEMPGEWASLVGRWKLMNAAHLVIDGKQRAPSAAFEYMLYQALVGAWPLDGDDTFIERMQAYALKAAREGKQETSWLNPNQFYENGLKAFIDRILDPAQSSEFLGSMQGFAERTALIGALNSLSQITLKATLPGVPDFYQGTEFYDFSLVDPDNRRPVDFDQRAKVLAAIGDAPDWHDLARRWRDGHIKLAWTRELLKLRKENAALFAEGDYVPLAVTGPHAAHVIAFARRLGGEAVIVAVTKEFAPLTQNGRAWPTGWDGAIELSGFEVDGAVDGHLPLAALFGDRPVGLVRARAATPPS